MIASHIHDALGQVDRMRNLILERRRFRGYSGTARILGGLAALVAAMVLGRNGLRSPDIQLKGWAWVLGAGLALNYGGLALRFLRRRHSPTALDEFRPALEVVPALAAGAALSYALVRQGQYDLLFGTWMACYGLSHMGYRHSLPRGILAVGLFYLAAGIACLLTPRLSFLNPWPMALVFFAGELAGGWILCTVPPDNPAAPAAPATDEEEPDETAR